MFDKQLAKKSALLSIKDWKWMLNNVAPIVLMTLLAPLNATAAPSISGVNGTVSHNQSVTISGSGFGTKSPAAPRVYSDFEDGTAGAALSSSDWALSYEYDPPRYSNELSMYLFRRSD